MNDEARSRLLAWIERGELRKITVVYRSTDRKKRGTSPESITVTLFGPGLELSAEGASVERCCERIVEQLEALAQVPQ